MGVKLKVGLDLEKEGVINRRELIERVAIEGIEGLGRSRIKGELGEIIGEGLKVGEGAVIGRVGFNLEDIQSM